MKIFYSIEIKANPMRVFYWLGDPMHVKEWMTSVTDTEIIKQTPDMVGTTFREIVSDESGSTELTGVVTDYVPEKRIAFHLEGRYNRVDVAYVLEDKQPFTLLTMDAHIQFKGFLKVMMLFMGPVFKKKIIAQYGEEFIKLKELCEQG